jgi:hypothetical protein
MGVVGEVLDGSFRKTGMALGVDDPFGGATAVDVLTEGQWVSQRLEGTVKLETAVVECFN